MSTLELVFEFHDKRIDAPNNFLGVMICGLEAFDKKHTRKIWYNWE